LGVLGPAAPKHEGHEGLAQIFVFFVILSFFTRLA